MLHVTLLAVGKIKSPWLLEGCEDYIGRLKRSLKFELVELPASRERDAARQREEESAKLIAFIKKHDADVWLLDEKGERMASHEFSFFVSQARDAGRPLLFVLGGAYGMTPEVRKAARGSMRLSDMTLPHELCRVVFLEQLYRATEIMRGSGYHH